MIGTDHRDGLGSGDVETLLLGLLVTGVIALFVWAACRAAGRPDWGAMGAAGVAIVGAVLTLAAVL